jgi:Toprim-like/CHC2 zinc finger
MKEHIALAKTFPCEQIMAAFGCQPALQRGHELVYFNPFVTERTPSFCVNVKGNVFKSFNSDHRGDAISLYRAFDPSRDFNSVVMYLVKNEFIQPTVVFDAVKFLKPTNVNTIIEVKDIQNKNLMAYLEHRCIDIDLARTFCKEVLYKNSIGRKYYGIGFKNDKGGYEIRSAGFKGCIGSKEITSVCKFKPGYNTHVFEGFMSFLSYYQKTHNTYNYVVLNSLSLLNRVPVTADTYFHLDYDSAGTRALADLKMKYPFVEDVRNHEGKDWNEIIMRQAGKI